MTKAPDIEWEKLLFRRQFVLGPRVLDVIPASKQARVAKTLHVEAHADLGVTQRRRAGLELTLLGYAVDPERPHATDADILDGLLAHAATLDALAAATDPLGGRWILIANDGQRTILFNDACGLRQVHYTDASAKETWCASQPGLLADALALERDPEAERDFLSSPYVRRDAEYWWPGDSSAYRGVRRLLPNHVLDLTTRTPSRFWPRARLGSLPLADGAYAGADLLRRLIEAAATRLPLAVGLTAGLDSRIVLAATKDCAPHTYYYTHAHGGIGPENADIAIPARLLGRLRLAHHAFTCPPDMSRNAAFAETYRRNTWGAHEAWGAVALGMFEHYPQDRVSVQGVCSEAARGYYYKHGYPRRVTGALLATLTGMGGTAFAAKRFAAWLEEAAPACREHGYDVLDLFYWEQRLGSWCATGHLEWDLVREMFAPFNCRGLLDLLLRVDRVHRRPRRYTLHLDMIQALWPETLCEPINPFSAKDALKYALLTATGAPDTWRYGLARAMQTRWKKRSRPRA